MGHKTHVSSMMHMRLMAMKEAMERYYIMTSEMVGYEVNGILTDTGARNICAPIYEFQMFELYDLDSSKYQPLLGY